MSYPLHVREMAFSLFCEGMSCAEMTDTLRRGQAGCERMGEGTVVAWCQRERWQARRRDIEARVRKQMDGARGDFMAEALTGLAEIRKRLVEAVRSNTPSSMEGGVNALVNIIKLERSMRGLDKQAPANLRIGQVQIVAIADKLLDEIERVPELGPLMERYRGAIIQRLTQVETPNASADSADNRRLECEKSAESADDRGAAS